MNLHNYSGWCWILSVRLYFAILGVGKSSLCALVSSAQTIRVVSQIYREQNNGGDVSQSENTVVAITDNTDWTIPILLAELSRAKHHG